MTLEDRAREFATKAHAGQKRKYTGAPYVTHCEAVAEIVRGIPGCTEEMIAAAWLHDTVEDCGVSRAEIAHQFGAEVALLVDALTDVSQPSDGNRKARKALDLLYTAQAKPPAKTIKLADLIDNTSTIVQYDPAFAKVYLQEKLVLLEVLKDGDPVLWQRAYDLAKEKAAV